MPDLPKKMAGGAGWDNGPFLAGYRDETDKIRPRKLHLPDGRVAMCKNRSFVELRKFGHFSVSNRSQIARIVESEFNMDLLFAKPTAQLDSQANGRSPSERRPDLGNSRLEIELILC